jgi:hypothetical protein
MQKRVRHVATSPETSSVLNTCREETARESFSDPSLWLSLEREKDGVLILCKLVH